MEYHKIEAPDFEFGLAKNLVSKTAHVAHQAAQAVCRAVQRVRQSRQASTDRPLRVRSSYFSLDAHNPLRMPASDRREAFFSHHLLMHTLHVVCSTPLLTSRTSDRRRRAPRFLSITASTSEETADGVGLISFSKTTAGDYRVRRKVLFP